MDYLYGLPISALGIGAMDGERFAELQNLCDRKQAESAPPADACEWS